MPRIHSKSPVSEVQDCMNAARGEKCWEGRNPLWRNLLKARNAFVKVQLNRLGLSSKELKDLEEHQRYYRIAQIENEFSTGFFPYSRDHNWMQQAVGEVDDWIKIDGMATWHVKGAISALEALGKNDTSIAKPPTENVLPPTAVFDAVKDAAESNTRRI